MTWFVLLAQSRSPTTEPFLRRTEDWVVVGMLAGTFLFGAVAIALVDRWRKRTEKGGVPSASELTGFRGMLDRGEITEEEYTRLRERVALRVKTAAKPSTGPQPPAAASADTGPRINLPGLIDWEADDAEERPPTSTAQQKLPGPETPTPPPEQGKAANPPPPV